MWPGPGRLRTFDLEDQSSANDYATVAAVSRPLVQESARTNRRRRNTKVARIGRIEHVGPQLQPRVFANARVLDDSEVEVANTVRAEDVAAGTAEARSAHRAVQSAIGVVPQEPHLFTGDSLFPGGPGKTWSPQNDGGGFRGPVQRR